MWSSEGNGAKNRDEERLDRDDCVSDYYVISR